MCVVGFSVSNNNKMTSDAFQLGSIKKISILLYKRKRHARWNCRRTNEKYRRRKTDIDYYVCCTYVVRHSFCDIPCSRPQHTHEIEKKAIDIFPLHALVGFVVRRISIIQWNRRGIKRNKKTNERKKGNVWKRSNGKNVVASFSRIFLRSLDPLVSDVYLFALLMGFFSFVFVTAFAPRYTDNNWIAKWSDDGRSYFSIQFNLCSLDRF